MTETAWSWVNSRLVRVEAIHAPLPSAAAYQLQRGVATISPPTVAIMYSSLISIAVSRGG
jgi:hypothetical protein